MRNTAVIHLPGNFRDVQFAISNQFLYPFDFMGDDELADGGSLHFRE